MRRGELVSGLQCQFPTPSNTSLDPLGWGWNWTQRDSTTVVPKIHIGAISSPVLVPCISMHWTITSLAEGVINVLASENRRRQKLRGKRHSFSISEWSQPLLSGENQALFFCSDQMWAAAEKFHSPDCLFQNAVSKKSRLATFFLLHAVPVCLLVLLGFAFAEQRRCWNFKRLLHLGSWETRKCLCFSLLAGVQRQSHKVSWRRWLIMAHRSGIPAKSGTLESFCETVLLVPSHSIRVNFPGKGAQQKPLLQALSTYTKSWMCQCCYLLLFTWFG